MTLANDKLQLESYLRDLGYFLRQRSIAVKSERAAAAGNEQSYADGMLMAYNEVISLMQQQALAFGIQLEVLNLAGIDPDKDLV
jgi:hypothetical protein